MIIKQVLFNCILLMALFCSHSTLPKSNTSYNLIIGLYAEKNSERQKEYLLCLEKNLKHPLIKKVHIIYDTSNHDAHDSFLTTIIDLAKNISQLSKIEITSLPHRQTYGDAFRLANHYYNKQSIILANADIYFNETLQRLETIDMNNKIITLTRWEPNKNGKIAPIKSANGSPVWGSQDVWIFKAPIKKFPGWKIPLGLQMCDHKIAFQMLQAGFDVVNPCLDVQSIHVHESNIRNWYHDHSRSLAYSAFIPWCKTENIKKRAHDHWVMS